MFAINFSSKQKKIKIFFQLGSMKLMRFACSIIIHWVFIVGLVLLLSFDWLIVIIVEIRSVLHCRYLIWLRKTQIDEFQILRWDSQQFQFDWLGRDEKSKIFEMSTIQSVCLNRWWIDREIDLEILVESPWIHTMDGMCGSNYRFIITNYFWHVRPSRTSVHTKKNWIKAVETNTKDFSKADAHKKWRRDEHKKKTETTISLSTTFNNQAHFINQSSSWHSSFLQKSIST